jgi:hypothetical protein
MPLHEEHEKRKGRNFVLGGILAALVILFFVVTLAKLDVI